MGWIARSQLASAVCEAGGMGIIETSSGEIDNCKKEILKMSELTDKPFGVNLPLLFLKDDSMVKFCVEAGVKFVTTSAGDPTKYISTLKDAGITVYHAVPSLQGALKAASAGVDGLVIEGTEGGGLITKVGNNCLIMVGAHVAHDCLLGNNIILANNASLAGHVQVDDFAILGGLSGVHQFVRIGSHAMVGGLSALESDVIPYGSVIGNRAYLSGLNIIGLKRRGFSREVIHDLRKAYRLLFAPEGTIQERIKDVSDEFKNNEPVMDIVEFIEGSASRAICQPKNGNKNT